MAQHDSHSFVRQPPTLVPASSMTEDCATSDASAQQATDGLLRSAADLAAVEPVAPDAAGPVASTSSAPLAPASADQPRSAAPPRSLHVARTVAHDDALEGSDTEPARSRPQTRGSPYASSSTWPRSSRSFRASSEPAVSCEPVTAMRGHQNSHGARARLALETSGRQETRIQQRKLRRRQHVAAVPSAPACTAIEVAPVRVDRPLAHHQLVALHQIHLPTPRFGGGLAGRIDWQATAITVPSNGPPITKTSLHELDLCEVLRNPQLRHDVVFDPHLMFRPNYDGERGQRKRQTAERYWTAVGRELDHGCRCTAFLGSSVLACVCGPAVGAGSIARRLPSRVPALVVELRQILCSLLPAPAASSTAAAAAACGVGPEQQAPLTQAARYAQLHAAASSANIEAALDPDLIAQQLEHGVLDLGALARFIGDTLKLHCAPMRDAAVDAMVACVAGPEPARGLRMCFELLELMKLVRTRFAFPADVHRTSRTTRRARSARSCSTARSTLSCARSPTCRSPARVALTAVVSPSVSPARSFGRGRGCLSTCRRMRR